MPIFLAAMQVVGAAISIYGMISGASAQSEAAERDAALKRQQANELIARQGINEGIMAEKADYAERQHSAAFAATGREGAGIGGMLAIHSDLEQNIRLSRRDAEFKASMLRAGADQSTQLSSDLMASGYISGAGTLLTSAGRAGEAYLKYKPSSQPKDLEG